MLDVDGHIIWATINGQLKKLIVPLFETWEEIKLFLMKEYNTEDVWVEEYED
ncbi:MAG: hypothetical protein AB7G87_14810 [Clostridia bacterium]